MRLYVFNLKTELKCKYFKSMLKLIFINSCQLEILELKQFYFL